jgi:hypothetical protein
MPFSGQRNAPAFDQPEDETVLLTSEEPRDAGRVTVSHIKRENIWNSFEAAVPRTFEAAIPTAIHADSIETLVCSCECQGHSRDSVVTGFRTIESFVSLFCAILCWYRRE